MTALLTTNRIICLIYSAILEDAAKAVQFVHVIINATKESRQLAVKFINIVPSVGRCVSYLIASSDSVSRPVCCIADMRGVVSRWLSAVQTRIRYWRITRRE